GHSQARAWMRAGYQTSQIDLAGHKVTFTLEGWPEGYRRSSLFDTTAASELAETAQPPLGADGGKAGKNGRAEQVHPLFGIWKGKGTLVPGYDYTRPAFEPDDPVDD